jgi:hypothetical protein
MSEPTFNESSFSNCSFEFDTTSEQQTFKDCSFYNCSFKRSNSSCVPPQQHQQQQEQDMQAVDDSTTPVIMGSNARVPLQQQQLQKQDMQAVDDSTNTIKGSNARVPLQQQQLQKQDMQAVDGKATPVIKTSNVRVFLQKQQLQKQDMQAADGTASPVVKTPGLLSSLLSAFFFQWKIFILFLILQQMVFWTIADHVRFQEPFGPEPAPEGWEAMMRLQERSRSSTVQLGIPPDVQGIVYVGIASNVLLRAIERNIFY